MTLFDAAKIAIKITNSLSFLEVREKDIDFPSRGALNINAAKRDFGFSPKVDVEEGFQIYYDWLKNDPYFGS